jgi:transposase-like protein
MNKEDVKMKKPNDDIRLLAKKEGVYLWQIADRLGIAEITLIRWLRKPLPEDKKKKILNAIYELAKEEYV